MNVLFVHNNFPAQYRNLASALAREPDVKMAAIGSTTARSLPAVKLIKYALEDADVSLTHPFARRFDLECRRAEQVLYGLSGLSASGFVPDVILAHPGWGETLPLRTVFPRARLLVYCEFFYGQGRDFDFDPEFPSAGLDGHVGLQLKNAATLLALADCDLGLSPTAWQRSTFPSHYQEKIKVVHDGIDTNIVVPNPNARLLLPSGQYLHSNDEVVTFVVRNMEPLRGYHVFMRALPEIMRRSPNAQIVVIGSDGLSYGMPPPAGRSWKDVYLEEVKERIDPSRLHFLGHVPYSTFLAAIQISSAHVYLTYPFVLSWSALEAMSAGCVVIGSDTPPVREVITSGETGLLVPFFDHEQLSERVVEVLQFPRKFASLRQAARRSIVENFDAKRICVPQIRQFLESVTEKAAAGKSVAPVRSVPKPRTRAAAIKLRSSAFRKKAT
jgi:glycosyltransferase involved in cell wall biosynthesis